MLSDLIVFELPLPIHECIAELLPSLSENWSPVVDLDKDEITTQKSDLSSNEDVRLKQGSGVEELDLGYCSMPNVVEQCSSAQAGCILKASPSCPDCFTDRTAFEVDLSRPAAGLVNVLALPSLSPQSSPKYPFRRAMRSIAGDLCYVATRDASFHRHCDVSLGVLSSSRIHDAITKTNSKTDIHSTRACIRRAQMTFATMSSSMSSVFVKAVGWTLLKVFRRLLNGVYVDTRQLEALRSLGQARVPVIYVPNHRSHIDYILMTHILMLYDIQIPHVAAGDNLNIPVFSKIIKWLGGFFIRRKLDPNPDVKDYVYRAILQEYVTNLLKQRQSLEFFIEGGRSRTGKMILPKAGVLSVVIDAVMKGIVDDVCIVPVSISYEHLFEGSYAGELMGRPKVVETFWHAVRSFFGFMRSNHGNVCLNFAEPVSLKEYLNALANCDVIELPNTKPDSSLNNSRDSTELESSSTCTTRTRHSSRNSSLASTMSLSSFSLSGLTDDRLVVAAVCYHIAHELERKKTLTCTNIVAFMLIYCPSDMTSLDRAVSCYEYVTSVCKSNGCGILSVGGPRIELCRGLHFLGISLKATTANPTTTFDLKTRLDISYYANGMISHFLLDAVVCRAAEILTTCSAPRALEFSQQDLLEKTLYICDVLQFEFLFCPPCATLTQVITSTIQSLVQRGILKSADHAVEEPSQNEEILTLQCSNIECRPNFCLCLSSSDLENQGMDIEEEKNNNFEQLLMISEESFDNHGGPLHGHFKSVSFLSNIVSPWIHAYALTAHFVNDLNNAHATLSEEQGLIFAFEEATLVSYLHGKLLSLVTSTDSPKTTTAFPECASVENVKNGVRLFMKYGILAPVRQLTPNTRIITDLASTVTLDAESTVSLENSGQPETKCRSSSPSQSMTSLQIGVKNGITYPTVSTEESTVSFEESTVTQPSPDISSMVQGSTVNQESNTTGSPTFEKCTVPQASVENEISTQPNATVTQASVANGPTSEPTSTVPVLRKGTTNKPVSYFKFSDSFNTVSLARCLCDIRGLSNADVFRKLT